MQKGYPQGQKTSQMGTRIIRILKANMYAYMVTIIFLLTTAVLLTHTNMGMNKEKIIIITGIILSTFIAGTDTAKGERKDGWKWGIVGSIVYAAIYFTIAGLTSDVSLLLCTNAIVMLCVMLCSGAVGGMFGINMRK
ncbi:MAG TPA: TIGR04086 family membrane protein [Epulopiscium sp.]|nr:TIGR04086 family membrane protein [Candidatus Epulonipiscium sp.]